MAHREYSTHHCRFTGRLVPGGVCCLRGVIRTSKLDDILGRGSSLLTTTSSLAVRRLERCEVVGCAIGSLPDRAAREQIHHGTCLQLAAPR